MGNEIVFLGLWIPFQMSQNNTIWNLKDISFIDWACQTKLVKSNSLYLPSKVCNTTFCVQCNSHLYTQNVFYPSTKTTFLRRHVLL